MKKWQSVVKVPLCSPRPIPNSYPIREHREQTSATSIADEKAEAAEYPHFNVQHKQSMWILRRKWFVFKIMSESVALHVAPNERGRSQGLVSIGGEIYAIRVNSLAPMSGYRICLNLGCLTP